MPYMIVPSGDKFCVHKQNSDKTAGELIKCHTDKSSAENHLKALYANVEDSSIHLFSMSIVKASFDKSTQEMRWRSVNSDTSPDLYRESMSIDLYKDFINRIESNSPIPEAFSSLCEDFWCGGMPYLSIAHYKSGTGGKNVPGKVLSVYMDGNKLKSVGTLDDTDLGRAVFSSLCRDLYNKEKGDTKLPIRISIGFLDLEHEHVLEGGHVVTFTRTSPHQTCSLCNEGKGTKIYKKGQLVHLALTRVPVNPRTSMDVEKSLMDNDIVTRRDDAESIIGELAESLEAKSLVPEVLVIKSDGSIDEEISEGEVTPFDSCYDPNTDSFNQDCVDAAMAKYMPEMRNSMDTVKSMVHRAENDGVHPAKHYLISEGGPEMWRFLVVNSRGEISTSLMEFAKTALDSITTKSKMEKLAESMLRSLYKSMEATNMETGTNKEVEKPVETEESGIQKALSALVGEISKIKSAGLAGEEALAAIQPVFDSLGKEIVNEFPTKSTSQPTPNVSDIAEIVRSVVQETLAPLESKIAQLEARTVTKVEDAQIKSRSIRLTPEILTKSTAQVPSRKLSQIEQIARKSTGVLS